MRAAQKGSFWVGWGRGVRRAACLEMIRRGTGLGKTGSGERDGVEQGGALRPGWGLAVACGVLLWGLAGCRHNPPPPPPATATAPPAQPASITHVAPLPPVPQPDKPKVGAPGSEQSAQTVEAPPPPPKPRKTKKHPVDSAAASAAGPSATATSAGGPGASPEPSLGQLSAGNGADSKERAAMTEEIRAQESRLSSIKRPLSAEGEAILVQIRAFLAKARQATADNDLDGARTLTTKAKVLLDELASS